MCDYFGCNQKKNTAKLMCDGKCIMRYCKEHGKEARAWLHHAHLPSHLPAHKAWSEELI